MEFLSGCTARNFESLPTTDPASGTSRRCRRMIGFRESGAIEKHTLILVLVYETMILS